jgi:hypothetical protein
MKKLILLTFGLILTFNVFADSAKGQRYYLKFMRPHFNMTGNDFAGQHLKVEWKQLFKKDAKKFIKVYSKRYPDAAEFLGGDTFKKIAPDVGDFVQKYAADSGELASCG